MKNLLVVLLAMLLISIISCNENPIHNGTPLWENVIQRNISDTLDANGHANYLTITLGNLNFSNSDSVRIIFDYYHNVTGSMYHPSFVFDFYDSVNVVLNISSDYTQINQWHHIDTVLVSNQIIENNYWYDMASYYGAIGNYCIVKDFQIYKK